MTIDPSTLPDGTNEHSVSDIERDLASVLNRYSVESQSGTPDFILAEFLMDGLRAFHRAVTVRADWRGESTELPALSAFSPDPLPSQEVPRDEWANIKPGSRVHAEHADGTVVTGEFLWCDDPVSDEIRIGCVRQKHAKVERVFVLDEPADPDADLIERVAKRLHDEADPQRLCAEGFGPGCGQRAKYIERARSALDVAKAAIAEVSA